MLAPDPAAYPEGKKDPDYIAALKDQKEHPEKWGARDPEALPDDYKADNPLQLTRRVKAVESRLDAIEAKGN